MDINLNDDIDKIVWMPDDIGARVRSLGAEISRDYEGKELFLIGMLKGAAFFMADLIRAMSISIQLDFMSISSYGSSSFMSGVVKIIKDLDVTIEDKHVLVVEDIVDTGLTLGYLLKTLEARTPASVKVCTFLDKPSHRIIGVPLHYVGFELDSRFVVGYGLDYQERYRHLPYIATLKREALHPPIDSKEYSIVEGQ